MSCEATAAFFCEARASTASAASSTEQPIDSAKGAHARLAASTSPRA